MVRVGLTRAEGLAYRRRWAQANAREIEELRATTPEQKLRQLASLMASIHQLGWTEALEAEVSAVRDRWARLRRLYAP